MAGSAWTNQLLNLIILSAAQSGFSGFFVYSPAPGPGNLIGSWAAAAGTDPYGNAYPAGLSVEVGNFTGIDLFLYNGTPAAGNLLVSMAAQSGTDAFGNHYLQGITSYATAFANSLIGGALVWWSGSQAGGWTFLGQFEVSGSSMIADFDDVQFEGTVEVAGLLAAQNGLTVNGSSDTSTDGLANGDIAGTSATAGLPNGDISGTSGAASAGTAHTHGPGSYAVTNGQHDHGAGTYAVTDGQHAHTL
jgi:hypothetical protein